MNDPHPPPEDAGLSARLRQARPAPSLPPRFQQNVWRRIEAAETDTRRENWLDRLANLVLRPRLAAGVAGGLLLAGVVAGTWQGRQSARQEAQMSYLAAVAPSVAP